MSAFVGEPTGAFAAFASLDDDMVKLVAYTIVSVRRDEEQVMPGEFARDQIIVLDRMTEEQVVALIIARYTSSQEYQDFTPEFKEAHAKYLRVYYVVTRRWPREPLRAEEREIKILQEISSRI
jgi:hypothetical protein